MKLQEQQEKFKMIKKQNGPNDSFCTLDGTAAILMFDEQEENDV